MSKEKLDLLDFINFDAFCRFLGLTRSAIRRKGNNHKKIKEIMRHHAKNMLADVEKEREKKK